MKKYIYHGDGACIPGLPTEISEEEINQFNVEQAQVWNDALKSGAYIEVAEEKPARVFKSSKKSDAPSGVPTDEGA